MSDLPDEMPQGDDLLAAELALGLLEGDELAQARTRATTDPAFALLVNGWHERLVAMTDEIAPVTPRKRVRKRLEKALFGARRVPLSERLWVWKGLSLVAIALAAYMGIQQLEPPAPEGALFATQLTGDAVPLQVLAVVDTSRGDVAINRVAGAEAPGRVFELWAIVPETAPVSLGVLDADGTMRVALPDALRGRAAEITLAISDEPTGGSPTGAPTGDVLAAAPLIAL